MRIDGNTKLVGLIGYPVTNSLSPLIHNAAFAYLGINWCYVPLPVKPGLLADAMSGTRALGFSGFNVTMPFKVEVILFLDELDEVSRSVGAVNTVRVEEGRLVGYNTDGIGFETALAREFSYDVEGKSILVIGAGGAAKSIAVTLAQRRPSSITIFNRTPSKGIKLRELIESNAPGVDVKYLAADSCEESSVNADLIINTTPLKREEDFFFPLSILRVGKEQLVCDINYLPPLPFLQWARASGARVMDGGGMLLYQAAAAFKIWTGIEAPIEAMKLALLDALGEMGSYQEKP
ncbi:MAG: shikimate dehydrogenase [Actinomycetota bacterium]|nr:shikimate dehydrogenase [Actinomycetota bacterium]